jgi:hypothetical protein
MARKIRLALSLGVYFAHNHREAEPALVQPLGPLSTYVWTMYYETPGFTSEAISRGPHAAEGRAPEAKRQDWKVRRQHDE